MTCDSIQDLLPWFVNGTLQAEEKAAVEAHLADCSSCREELERTVELGMEAAQHVPISLLLDFAEGKPVSSASVKRIEEHLAICPVCEEELEIAREHVPSDPLPFPTPVRTHPSSGLLAAAAVLIVAAGLGWIWSQYQLSQAREESAVFAWEGRELRKKRDQLEEQRDALTAQRDTLLERLSAEQEEPRDPRLAQATPIPSPEPTGTAGRPILNVPLLELVPDAVLRGDEVDSPGIEPRGAPYISLVLISEVVPEAPSELRVEIRTAAGDTIWKERGLRRGASGNYVILLPTQELPAGAYKAGIFIQRTGYEEMLEEFGFRIRE